MTSLAFVNGVAGGADASSPTIASPSWNLTTGNHVFVWVAYISGTTTTTLADTAGNTYTALTEFAVGSSALGRWFYTLGAAGNSANIVTATYGSAKTERVIKVFEVSGTTPTSVSQVNATVAAASTTIDTGTSGGNITAGIGGMVLACEFSQTNSDSSATIVNNDGAAMTQVATGYTRAYSAYRALPAGAKDEFIIFTGTSSTATSRILSALVLDIGGSVPSADTKARLTQMSTEVIRNIAVVSVVSQVAVEVIRPNLGVLAVVSQTAVEVLRPNATVVVSKLPQVCVP